MSMVLEDSVTEVLRGDRASRPPADHAIAAALWEHLETRVRSAVAPTGSVRVGPTDLRATGGTPVESALAVRLRGALVTHLLALLTVGFPVTHPFADALAAWRAEGDSPDLVAYADSLDGDDLARVRTDVDAHGVTLVQRLGPVSPRWWPRTRVRTNLRLAEGRLCVVDTVDLVVGSTSGERATVALLDVTTSPHADTHGRLLRYHALCETLRTGVAPLRAVALSTATGETMVADVDRALLECAADELVAAVVRATSRMVHQ